MALRSGREATGFRDFAVGIVASDMPTLRRNLGVVDAAAEPLVAEAPHLVHDGEESFALRGERVLDARRRLRVALARDDLLRLEPPQPLRERPRADPFARALELCEAAGPLREVVDDEHRPLRADDLSRARHGARRRCVNGEHRARGHELIVRS